MLFTARSAPEPKATELVSLCCSLNSPVVSIPELPVGPASAAIAIHTNGANGSHITVALQCQRTMGVVLFGAQGQPGEQSEVSTRSALLWAEGMGFLFDDDLCGDPANEKGVRNEIAIEVWRELVLELEPVPADPEPRTDLAESDTAAILSKFRFQWSTLSKRSAPVVPETNSYGDRV